MPMVMHKFRHTHQISPLIAKCVDGSCFPGNGQNSGAEVCEFIRGDGISGIHRFVKGHMPVDSQTAEAHICAAQVFQHPVILRLPAGFRKMALGFRHNEFGIYPVIELPLHPPVKTHRIVAINALCPRAIPHRKRCQKPPSVI